MQFNSLTYCLIGLGKDKITHFNVSVAANEIIMSKESGLPCKMRKIFCQIFIDYIIFIYL